MTDQSISISISLSEYGVRSAVEIETDVIDSQLLRLSLAGSSVPLVELSFPCKIDDDTVTAKYKSRTGVLVVSARPAAAQSSHPHAADIQVQQGHGDASGVTVPPCIPGGGEPGPPGRSPGRASLAGSPVGNSEASDAALMRDFADEAYMVSLTIGDTLASAQRQQQPMTSEQPVSMEGAEAGGRGSSPQSQQDVEVTNSGASMAQPTTGVETSASGIRVAAAEAPGPKMQDGEGPVRMAAGISGVGLAAQLGYPFTAPSTSAPSAGNAKKAKKRERKKATDAAAATLQQLADSLQTQGWAVCGEELGGHNVTTACCPMPHAPCALR